MGLRAHPLHGDDECVIDRSSEEIVGSPWSTRQQLFGNLIRDINFLWLLTPLKRPHLLQTTDLQTKWQFQSPRCRLNIRFEPIRTLVLGDLQESKCLILQRHGLKTMDLAGWLHQSSQMVKASSKLLIGQSKEIVMQQLLGGVYLWAVWHFGSASAEQYIQAKHVIFTKLVKVIA